ncbi:monocarboxylate transporter, putative [Talaromyces stipitatus ATCC 10500]|uniref:Monocarboxylate transporter, putative n=1 Tax=Talaromyces stipitatus (strain ATCC 10500 / CBS 375.48 / QM 6759 / NRRL 1006) TaxID=441959 RepID=B8M9G8_TALSN|nr:monocarboxylate transporter, putative [Talaromyces stipitatus ATCC 10500]EED17728.1 monocarboxylate transporter, putative [Talaromyces stipitatus ATCC 10500]
MADAADFRVVPSLSLLTHLSTEIVNKMAPDTVNEANENRETESPSANKESETNNTFDAPKSEVAKPPAPPPPPDGGLSAWLQVVGAFVIFFNTWGQINTFGVFQTYYESGALFTESSSNISWIGSIQCFLLQLTGIVAGPIYDRGYLRLLLFFGSFMIVFGYMMLSLCHEYWQAMLAQAFCVGIGSGLLFTPTVSLLPTWFSSHIGLAVGIASSGGSFGGVIYPIVLYRLIGQIGFPWAVRTMAFIALGTFFIPVIVMKQRLRPPKPRAVIDWSAFRDAPYMTFALAILIVFIGNSVLIFYISYYPIDKGFTDSSLGFYIVAIFNAASIFGRIAPNAVSDRIGVFNTFIPMALVLSITVFCLLAVVNTAGMVVEAVVTGFLSGVIVALPPVCFTRLTPNRALIGTRLGLGFAIGGLGLLIGGPTAGAILGTSEESLNWTGLWVYGGVTIAVAGFVLAVVRVMKAGSKPMIKV